MRSDNLDRHEKNCKLQNSEPVRKMVAETEVKRKYIPPSSIYDAINMDLSETPPKKKSLSEKILSLEPLEVSSPPPPKKLEPQPEEIVKVPPPNVIPLKDLQVQTDSDEDSESDDESRMDEEEISEGQQLKDRLASLLNLYYNDKRFEFKGEILNLIDELYNSGHIHKENREKVLKLVGKMQDKEEEEKKNAARRKVEELFKIFEEEKLAKDVVSSLKHSTEDFIADVREKIRKQVWLT